MKKAAKNGAGSTKPINLALQAQLLSIAMTPAAELGSSDCLYVVETQHNVCGTFRTFFDENGGAAIFGNPLSEQYIIDGKPVQYFERARFEWTAGTNGQPDYVLLSRLGAHQRMAQVGQEIDPPRDHSDLHDHTRSGEVLLGHIDKRGAEVGKRRHHPPRILLIAPYPQVDVARRAGLPVCGQRVGADQQELNAGGAALGQYVAEVGIQQLAVR